MDEQSLRVRDLTVDYVLRDRTVRAVDRVSLDIRPGGITAVVGESGSGKSTLARALLRVIEPPARITSGELTLDGERLSVVSERQMRRVRGRRISMILQNPQSSLNPVMTVGAQLRDTYRAHYRSASTREALRRAAEVVESLAIPRDRLSAYPHELSGGMCQRVMIGMGLICGAQYIVADEPTTGLDVLVGAQFMEVLRRLCDEQGTGVVLVSHDIGLVSAWARDVAVMYAGRLAEVGSVERVFDAPGHPYTAALLAATPTLESRRDDLTRMKGAPPDMMRVPGGCPFHPRCPEAMDVCSAEYPPDVTLEEGDASAPAHRAACWLRTEQGAVR